MKKLFAILFIVMLILALVACGDEEVASSAKSTDSSISQEKSESETPSSTPSVSTSTSSHEHEYTATTCNEPQKCSCGATKYPDTNAHNWNFGDGTCTVCKTGYPDFIALKDSSWELKNTDALTKHEFSLSSENFFGEPYFAMKMYIEEPEQDKAESSNRFEKIGDKWYSTQAILESTIKTKIKKDTLTITFKDVATTRSITFKRTAHDTLTVTKISGSQCCGDIKVGTEFKIINR